MGPSALADPAAAGAAAAGLAIVERAPAKVNLCLHVTGRRPDGYHELDSLVAFADVGDEVVATGCADAAQLLVFCDEMPVVPVAGTLVVPGGTANLAWRALAALATAIGGTPGIEVTLRKRLPAGAGLGGGSSDAAAVIRAAAALHAREGELPAPLLALGADVPMCLLPRPWRVRGIGEQLQPVTLAHDLPALLVWPGRAVATPAVFRARTGDFGAAIPETALALLARDPLAALAGLRNDLEAAARAIEPAVGEALEAVRRLARCRLARMSGSGSAVFGLFERDADAAAAAATLAGVRPDWWVRATTLHAGPVTTRVDGRC